MARSRVFTLFSPNPLSSPARSRGRTTFPAGATGEASFLGCGFTDVTGNDGIDGIELSGCVISTSFKILVLFIPINYFSPFYLNTTSSSFHSAQPHHFLWKASCAFLPHSAQAL